ncbi:hypothetical protein [Thermus sediminis]|uniref:hypothetical protein n=1 Tax=Thermus sediminis TaxID=1761908 RepID=UPI000E3EB79E|nr:hypothetical protein [Thermus sediminis]
MEVLGPYWLRRILARIGPISVYEGQDTRTGMPVMVLKGAEGKPVTMEGVLPLLESLPEGWVLEWPLGAVPLSQYLGMADPDRLEGWVKELARILVVLRERGVEFAPLPEICLVKGRRLWLAGVGLEALKGSPEKALASLAKALAADWQVFALREALEVLEGGEARLEDLFRKAPLVAAADASEGSRGGEPSPSPEEAQPSQEASHPEPAPPHSPVKRLLVEPVEEPPEPSPPSPGGERTPSRPRVIRIEERDEPPFPVVEPPRPRGSRRALLLLLLLLGLLGLLGLFLRPRPALAQGYLMEFRTDPPTEQAEVVLLEVPPGSEMIPGQVLLTAPGRAEFDQQGIYRLRIRVPGRDPVDYLLEVPGPPLTIKVR